MGVIIKDGIVYGNHEPIIMDEIPIEDSHNFVESGGVYSAIAGNFDDLLPQILNAKNYTSTMKLWFKQNGAEAMTDFSSLCDRWYMITRTGWTGGTRFYHATTSMASDGAKVGDNAGMVAIPSTDTEANQDDYQDVPLFHCLDCNWVLDEDGKPRITAIDGVCGDFERSNPEKLVGVIQMTGWCKYVEDAENDTYAYMYTDDASSEGYAPLPEAVDPDGTVRSWVVHGKYLSGDDYGCYSGARPWAYTASHNSTLTNYHTKWGNQYGGKTCADDAFLKLMFFLKYGSLSADDVLQGCVNYNYQYPVVVEETGVERVILTSSQAANIKVGSTVMVGNPTAFSSGTTLNIDRGQAGMRAKVDRKKVTRKETLSSGEVAAYIENGGVTFDTTTHFLQNTKSIDSVSLASIDDAVGGAVLNLTVNTDPVQSGSGNPSPDNVRPISGWTGAKVARCGKNLSKFQNNSVIIALAKKGVTYTFSVLTTDLIGINIRKNSIDGTVVRQLIPNAPGKCTLTFTADEDYGVYLNLWSRASGKTVADLTSEYQLELGSTATDYEPYQDETYSITFPSEAGTVYGGTLDVVNGALMVDRAMVSNTVSYIKGVGAETPMVNCARYAISNYCPGIRASSRNSVICNSLPMIFNTADTPHFYTNDNGQVLFTFSNDMDESANIELVYPLATPITYQLAQQEIELLTGNNVVSADCGDIAIQYMANIPAPTYVSTSPWFTGTCDNVKGKDGSPTDSSNGSEPYILQGIECALGGYEVFSDTIIKYYKDASGKYHLTYYICRDAGKYSTGITADYDLVDYEVDCPASNSWLYISEHGWDESFPEACFPHLIGCTSSQRTKDGMYILATSEYFYQYLSLGNLNSSVESGGLSFVNATHGLGYGLWYFLARLSPNGNRGIFNGGE